MFTSELRVSDTWQLFSSSTPRNILKSESESRDCEAAAANF